MATRRPAGYDRAAAEENRKATLEVMHQQISDGIAALAGEWQAYLRFASGFSRYSVNNQILLWVQDPHASLVAGYRTWQAKGRQVRHGEKALKVLGPVTRRVPILDSGGTPVRNPDGTPRVGVQLVGVKPVSVFDVRQTSGDPIPETPTPTLLVGEAPPGLWDSVQAFIEERGFEVSRRDCGDANGVTRFDTRQVWVRPDIDEAAAAKTIIHEAAHLLMHADLNPQGCRGVREVEAESVAYLVTHSHGLDSSQYTFHYVTGWAHAARQDDPTSSIEDIIRNTATRVVSAADQILQATQAAPHLIDGALEALDRDVSPGIDGEAADRTPAFETITPRKLVTREPTSLGAPSPRVGVAR